MNNPYKLVYSKYSTHKVIAEQIPPQSTVLDVGCNDGYLADIVDTSVTLFGLDYSPQSIEKARTRFKDARVSDLNTLELINSEWPQQYDVIVFADVLEHLYHPEKVLTHYMKYLQTNGSVIISLPNYANWSVRLSLLFGKIQLADSGILDRTHLHMYTYEIAQNMVKDCGLKVEKVLFGAKVFGPIIQLYPPLLRGLLSTGIILVCKK